MRGKDLLIEYCLFTQGITPACAGKRKMSPGMSWGLWDHPRMCGEKVTGGNLLPVNKGSPPHVRGKARLVSVTDARLGITPACAGKSVLTAYSNSFFGDHPRMCGEKCWEVPEIVYDYRITPACAGKRRTTRTSGARCRDHPRMCGEKGSLSKSFTAFTGSPPHVRGKVLCVHSSVSVFGITPACAGKSAFGLLSSAESEDHPRMCGEKGSGLPAEDCLLGLPPHVRGKVLLRFSFTPGARITPACAGKS